VVPISQGELYDGDYFTRVQVRLLILIVPDVRLYKTVFGCSVKLTILAHLFSITSRTYSASDTCEPSSANDVVPSLSASHYTSVASIMTPTSSLLAILAVFAALAEAFAQPLPGRDLAGHERRGQALESYSARHCTGSVSLAPLSRTPSASLTRS
jgi:hypothetical protein